MILIEQVPLDADTAIDEHEVLSVLSAHHVVFRYSSIDALEAWLELRLDELKGHGVPRALSRALLFYRHPRAIDVVSSRMCPGFQVALYRVPEAWPELAGRIEQLRAWSTRLTHGSNRRIG